MTSKEPTAREVTVDARGTLCPQPVIDLARAFATAESTPDAEVVVVLLADDAAAVHDVPAWCRMRGCTSTVTTEADGSFRFVVRRTAAS